MNDGMMGFYKQTKSKLDSELLTAASETETSCLSAGLQFSVTFAREVRTAASCVDFQVKQGAETLSERGSTLTIPT